jgi:hypothetical protein
MNGAPDEWATRRVEDGLDLVGGEETAGSLRVRGGGDESGCGGEG